eukprot:CAMPEP_0176418568 /NCGR_PEP_ID=MMETSP0127-20121128/7542_1 /TAXON_ID=938130 /ORGANISM="Platyophrya macrostoma, Strain WH" /LENGTH=108 /DNA_ID=CAMNT_0017798905 /DNA_START=217 /DNA_END=540 /DNA_ORIENTATION=-
MVHELLARVNARHVPKPVHQWPKVLRNTTEEVQPSNTHLSGWSKRFRTKQLRAQLPSAHKRTHNERIPREDVDRVKHGTQGHTYGTRKMMSNRHRGNALHSTNGSVCR